MHARIVKIIPLNAPGIGKNLLPLGGRIDHRFDRARGQFLIKLLRFLRLDDRVLLLATQFGIQRMHWG